MANSKGQEAELQQLAQYLIDGDRKNALSFVRKRLSDPFDDEYQMLLWNGWERALNRQEAEALIVQLLNGMATEDAKKAHKDLRKKRTELLIRDHTQTELSKKYIGEWAKLLDFYCELCEE